MTVLIYLIELATDNTIYMWRGAGGKAVWQT